VGSELETEDPLGSAPLGKACFNSFLGSGHPDTSLCKNEYRPAPLHCSARVICSAYTGCTVTNARCLEVFGTLATQIDILIVQTFKRSLKHPSSMADQYVAPDRHHFPYLFD
jgi:hypothetical protein